MNVECIAVVIRRLTTHNVAEMELGRDKKTGKVMWLTAIYWHWIVPADIEDPVRQ